MSAVDVTRGGAAVAEAARANRGCASYDFFADVEDENRIISVEIWQDRTALDEHLRHPHTEQFLQVAPGLVAGEPVMAFYDMPATDLQSGPAQA